MSIAMHGNWTVAVKEKNASYPQRFIIAGADIGNGIYDGVASTSVNVVGTQWTVTIQSDPGSGFVASTEQIKFPTTAGGEHRFEIRSNDAGHDSDFNDLILECSTPETINDFLIYGNVSEYSGLCLFNPCRRFPFVIDSLQNLRDALTKPRIKEYLEKYFPERIPQDIDPLDPLGPIGPVDPIDPADPAFNFFKPIVIDPTGVGMQPKKKLYYSRNEAARETKTSAKKRNKLPEYAARNYRIEERSFVSSRELNIDRNVMVERDLYRYLDRYYLRCTSSPLSDLVLSFEEYDRTASELAGGAYTGEGNRRYLGEVITDSFGNYIFRYTFDMSFPGIEDSADIGPGEDINVVAYPDIIITLRSVSPYGVLWESAPYYNVPNKKRINLCLPRSVIPTQSMCTTGNMLGSIGKVFLGGNQNASASTNPALLTRDGYNNYLASDGQITVRNTQTGFQASCAAWHGVLDLRGCLYEANKPDTNIKWFTVRIRREGSPWIFVSENHKHPVFANRNLANYNGDDVGPFFENLHVDGGASVSVPAYKNINREVDQDGITWEFTNRDILLRLNTRLYDNELGQKVPGTFHVRIDGYDENGNPVPGATDMIPLYIHNKALDFKLGRLEFMDPSIVPGDCGLHRLSDAQLLSRIKFSYQAEDLDGFVNAHTLTIARCPNGSDIPGVNTSVTSSVSIDPTLIPPATVSSVILGNGALTYGETYPAHTIGDACAALTGMGLNEVELEPSAPGWIAADEYFSRISLSLVATMRKTNGYNTGVTGPYKAYSSIIMEKLTFPSP